MSSTTSLITGGAGFIGAHLCDRLLAEEYRVICLDDLSTGRLSNIAHLMPDPRFTLIKADAADPPAIPEQVDLIVHLASPASPKDYLARPIETLKAGSLGTAAMLDLARRKHARFIFASSSETYGCPAVHPQTESYAGNVDPAGPRAAYGEAKRFGEALTMAYRRTRGVNAGIIRIFNCFGRSTRTDDGRVVPTFIAQATSGRPLTVEGDGHQTRTFMYVSDLIDAIVAMAGTDASGPVNIGGALETRIIDLAHLIIELTGSRSEIVYTSRRMDDPAVRKPDISLAERLLHWSPAVSLREGLIRTIDGQGGR